LFLFLFFVFLSHRSYRNQPVPLPPSVLRSLHAEAEKAAVQSQVARKYKLDHDARTPYLSHHLDRARQEAHEIDNPLAIHNPLLSHHSQSHARHCFTGSDSGLPIGVSSTVPHSHGPRAIPGPQPLPAHALAISADGTLLATIGADPTSIVLLATETLRQVRLLSTQSLPVAKLLFAPLSSAHAPQELVAVLSDSSFQRFLVSDGSLIAHVSATPSMKFKQERALNAPSREIGLSFAAAGQVSIPKSSATCTSAALSPLGLYLLTGSNDPLLRVWDFHARPHAPHFQSLLAHQSSLQPAEGVTGITFSPDGRTVLTTGGDAIWMWKLLADEAAIVEAKARKYRRSNDERMITQALLRDGEEQQGNGRIPTRMYSGGDNPSHQQQELLEDISLQQPE
jgi:WD40 repeat protein